MNPEPDTTAAPPLDPEFLALLCCPACPDRPPVRLDEKTAHLLCDRCGRAYPIRDGLPSLIVDDAEEMIAHGGKS